ncbi:MAG: hypothetical protein IJM33_00930 [Bacteroidales bacterium]|nr:hypothetical protein [Bacteroidales bacterium]MBR3412605.1 hypothetical protein [Bacteroidales bacterium]
MKKTLVTLLLALTSLSLASCGSKDCRCYELSGSHWTGPHTTMTAAGTRCADLNSRTLKCNEMEEPIINPDDIGVDNKKK